MTFSWFARHFMAALSLTVVLAVRYANQKDLEGNMWNIAAALMSTDSGDLEGRRNRDFTSWDANTMIQVFDSALTTATQSLDFKAGFATRLFILPEWSFRRFGSQPFTLDEARAIILGIKDVLSRPEFADMVVAPGTIHFATPSNVVFNCAPLIVRAKGSNLVTMRSFQCKALDGGDTDDTAEAYMWGGLRSQYRTVNDEQAEIINLARNVAVVDGFMPDFGSKSIIVNGVKLAVEICLDHSESAAARMMDFSWFPEIPHGIQILVASGQHLSQPVRVATGGLLLRVDGAVSDFTEPEERFNAELVLNSGSWCPEAKGNPQGFAAEPVTTSVRYETVYPMPADSPFEGLHLVGLTNQHIPLVSETQPQPRCEEQSEQ